jgi:hypothetical protein
MHPCVPQAVDKWIGEMLLAAGLVLYLVTAAYAAPGKCTREDAIKAEKEASSLKNWQAVFKFLQKIPAM